jgi:hypothetical protein
MWKKSLSGKINFNGAWLIFVVGCLSVCSTTGQAEQTILHPGKGEIIAGKEAEVMTRLGNMQCPLLRTKVKLMKELVFIQRPLGGRCL